MRNYTAKHDNVDATPWRARFAAALTIAVASFVIAHSLDYSVRLQEETLHSAVRVENQFAAQQRSTTVSSAIGFFMLGGLGAGFWLTAPTKERDPAWLLVLLGVTYFSWHFLSLSWSVDPSQSIRKLAILGLMLTGAYGLATRFDRSDLVWIIALVTASLVVIGILAEVAQGTFRPWRNDYRFAGTCHPNDQGLQCALLVLAAGLIEWDSRTRNLVARGLMLLGVVGLVLSKSRTTLAALLVAVAVAVVLSSRGLQRWIICSVGVSAICVIGIAAHFGSVSTLSQTANVAAMGRTQNVSSLTGRLPLWDALWHAVDDQPMLGYGFGAFWNEPNILRFSKMFRWHIPHAHNAYLDLALAIGLVGLVLHILWIVATTAIAIAQRDRYGRRADLFAACFLAFAIVHGVTESKLPNLGMGGFFLLTIAGSLALRATETQAVEADGRRMRRQRPGPFAEPWRGRGWNLAPHSKLPGIN
jgi:O-antigen ligase